MTEAELTMLIRRYLSGEATQDEKIKVEQWYESFDGAAPEFMDGNAERIKESAARSLDAIRKKMAAHTAKQEKAAALVSIRGGRAKAYRWRVAAAAVLLLLFSGTAYFLTHTSGGQQTGKAVPVVKHDIAPGGNKAMLTLGNGTRITLDSIHPGMLPVQGNVRIMKLGNGRLVCKAVNEKGKSPERISFNTLTTPRGGQYEIILPDGTRVWLNAASSIRFPTAFTGGPREVQVTGEAYFEVTRDAKRPFIVKVPPSPGEEALWEIKVLGTHFNVNAYNDEASMKVTLLEGKVKVSERGPGDSGIRSAKVVRPGEQARVKKDGIIKLVKNADTEKTMAWTHDLFWFENDDVHAVMRQLSRWYDVDIVVQGDIRDRFTGSIPRNLTFSRIFEILQQTGGMHYEIENRKIIVSS
ncbi:FecR family protein [Compostibacter hankyongensis]|uniref:DUF4974 domain-containing protein n=1 Tax=Compostibacter hankyongensis TaxID=1007089 RepID=A0ABP8G237_9BACT